MTKKIDKQIAIKELANRDWSFSITILFIFSLIFFFNYNLKSQVLINEYFNTSSNQEEWIELIVTEENANLTNLILLDSKILDSSPDEFNGGVQFKNVTFWNSIPKGTFIVIYLRDVDNSLLGIDKVKGRISVKATDESLFEKVCENCDIGNWENEAFIIENDAELFSIALNSTNIHSLGHTSNGVGHFVNNMGILTNATMSNNQVLSVIPGDSELNYFAGYDANNDFAVNHNFKTVGGANRKSSGSPQNYLFTDNLRIPNSSSSINFNISKVNNQFKVRWDKYSNLPQPDIYYSLILLLTPNNPGDNDLPKNGTNYQKNDIIGNSIVLEVFQGNQSGNVDILSNMNCGTNYTVSLILGRFRDLNNNYNQFLSNGISYNTKSFPTGIISRAPVPNFSIFTENNLTKFCIQSDTTITINSDIQNKESYKFIWFKNGTQYLVSNQFGENSSLQISEGGQYFLQLLNADGCVKNSNVLNLNIDYAPKVDIYYKEKIISNDTIISICKDDELILKSQSDFGAVEWYKKIGNSLILVENSFELNVTEMGDYLSVAREGTCRDTSKIVTVNFLDYSFSVDKSIIAIYKYNNVNKITSTILKNEGNQTLTFNANDISIEAPFKLININFPIILEPGEEIEIEILLDSDDFEDREYDLVFNNLCNNTKTTKLRGFKINSNVVVNPMEIKFPPRLRCKENLYDTTLVILNNSDVELEFNAKVKLPYIIDNFLPVFVNNQDSIKLKLNFATNDEGLFRDTLRIYFKDFTNNINDSILIPLETFVYEPYLDIEPDTLDIGSLGECIEYVDTTIKLTNIYPIDISIESQSNIYIDLENLPIVIPSESTIEIPIRVNILNAGLLEQRISLLSLPCTNSNDFFIKGYKSTTSYNFDDKEIDFGTFFTCDGQISSTFNSKLRITSDDALNTGIDSIYVPQGFQTNLKLGQELFNLNDFSVTFTPNQTGLYDEYIKIRFYPCGEIDSIRLKGELKEIDFEVPDKIEFDLVEVANNSMKNLKILNKSFHNLEFEIDNIPNTKFTILNNSNNIELDNYDDEYELELNYISLFEGKDTSYILIRITEPCFIEKEVILIGETFPKDVIDININTTNDLIHNANEELEIDIEIYSDLYNLDDFDIKDVELQIETNAFILNLLNVSYNLNSNVNFNYDIENNLINITFAQLQESNFKLTFQPLVGKGVESKIIVKNLSFTTNEEVIISYDSLNVELVGICDLEDRQFNIGKKADIELSQETLSKVNITAKISNGEKTMLNIYDVNGSIVKELINSSKQIGEYNFEVTNLPSGVYFITLENGLEYKQKSFIISK